MSNLRKIVIIEQNQVIPDEGKYLTSVTLTKGNTQRLIFFYEVPVTYTPIEIPDNKTFNPQIGKA